jgi:hypothetical protein
MLVGTALISGMVYALMQTYDERENRLLDITLNDFKDRLIINFRKYIILIFFSIAIVIFAVAIAGIAVSISKLLLFIIIPLMIILALLLIPLSLTLPIYLFEEHISIIDAIKKSWKLGTSTLWGMVGLMIVLYIISSVIQSVAMIPWGITIFVGTIFSTVQESTMNQSVIYKFLLYLFGLIQSFGLYASSMIGLIGLAFHYFHAREKVEGVSIESNISNFNEL